MTFRYNRPLLEPTTETLQKIAACAAIRCTKREAAGLLGVSHGTLDAFFHKCEEARQAWEDGKAKGKASLRRLLWTHAQSDPPTARFLAKDTRWLGMDEGKDREVVRQQVNVQINVTPEDRRRRVEELQMKVLEHVPALKPD